MGAIDPRNCLSREIRLTDDQISAAFAAAGTRVAVGYGAENFIAVTRDTLDDFRVARSNYRKSGSMFDVDAAGHPAIVILGVQVSRFHRRGDLYVIDFGEVRAVYHVS